jgi:hypothetical protein
MSNKDAVKHRAIKPIAIRLLNFSFRQRQMDHKPVLRRPSANQEVRSLNPSRRTNYQEPSTTAIDPQPTIANDRNLAGQQEIFQKSEAS